MITFLLLHPIAGVLIPLLLKATLVILLALAVTELLRWRRGSAAARHLVWALAIGALLALPLLSWGMPQWRVGVLTLPGPSLTAGSTPAAEPLPFGEGSVMIPDPSPPAAQQLPGSAYPAPAESPWPTPGAAVPQVQPERSRLELAEIALGLYLLGVLLLLLRLWVGRWSVRSLSRSAEPVEDPAWAALLRDLSWTLGVERPVRLLRSREASLPMTWGTRRPAILLPAQADGWPEERRRVVLLHELAHVARRDCLVQTLAALACALYWFHPLVWYAARRLRIERELACDDQVLAAGTRAKSYAAHLLEVARAYRPASLTSAVAISMARPSQLEGRLLAVLDRTRSRRVLSARATALAVASALGLLLPLGALQPGTARAATPHPHGPATLPAAHAFLLDEAVADTIPGQVIERTLPARSGGRLTLDLVTGGTVRVKRWDREAVFVHTELGGPDWQGTQVAIIPLAEGVHVESSQERANRSYGTSHKFEIRVPARFDVDVRSGGGAIQISDLEGTFTGHTNGGELRLERLQGAVRLSTNGGEILVTDSHLDGEVGTNGGDVVLRNVTGSLQGVTNGGSVIRGGASAREAFTASQPIQQHRDGGAIRIEHAPLGADLHTGGGEIRVRSAGNFVRARTGGGPIILEAVDGQVYASTGAGNVAVTLVGDPARGSRDVEIRSGSGNVTLMLPAGIEAEFDIETAYTNNLGRQVRIVSDFPLRQSESQEWVRDRGAPRRLVHASGSTGSARNRIRIRTVNGDVFLRRAGSGSSRSAAGAAESRADLDFDCVGANCTLRSVVERDRDRGVQHDAVRALAATYARTSDPTGERLPFSVDERALAARVSDAALRGAPDAAAIRRLRPLLGHVKAHEADLVRERATWALAQLREGRLIEPLLAALRDPDWRVRSYAAWALGVTRDAHAARPLIASLADTSWRVRMHAAASLGSISDRAAVGPLLALLRDPEWQVRAAAAEALGELGDGQALAALEPLLHDPHVAVRGVAEPALKKLRKTRG